MFLLINKSCHFSILICRPAFLFVVHFLHHLHIKQKHPLTTNRFVKTMLICQYPVRRQLILNFREQCRHLTPCLILHQKLAIFFLRYFLFHLKRLSCLFFFLRYNLSSRYYFLNCLFVLVLQQKCSIDCMMGIAQPISHFHTRNSDRKKMSLLYSSAKIKPLNGVY